MSLQEDVALAREDAEKLLPDIGRVLVHSRESDGGGGYDDSYAPGGDVQCRIAPIGGGEGGTVGDRVDDRTTHVLTLPAGTVVGAVDRFEVDDHGVYEVTAPRTRSMEFVRRIEVRQVS